MTLSLPKCINRTHNAARAIQAALLTLDPAAAPDHAFEALTVAARATDALARALALAQERAGQDSALAFDRAWKAGANSVDI